jgi:hypothetical protein
LVAESVLSEYAALTKKESLDDDERKRMTDLEKTIVEGIERAEINSEALSTLVDL